MTALCPEQVCIEAEGWRAAGTGRAAPDLLELRLTSPAHALQERLLPRVQLYGLDACKQQAQRACGMSSGICSRVVSRAYVCSLLLQ